MGWVSAQQQRETYWRKHPKVNPCECGCGELVRVRFVSGHNRRGVRVANRVATSWVERHPERVREMAREHYAQRTERIKARVRLGKLRRAGNQEAAEYGEMLRRDPCSYCGTPLGGTVDHIEPVSTGGEHVWENLTGACRRCNSGKQARSLLAALLQRKEKLRAAQR